MRLRSWKLVSTILKACAEEVQIDEEAFVKRFQEEQEDRVDEEAAKNQERLRTAKRRKDELMTLLNRFMRIISLGKLPDDAMRPWMHSTLPSWKR